MKERYTLKELKSLGSNELLIDSIYDIIEKDMIIFCVGTDKCVGDALGPLVGHFLESKNTSLTIVGTLHYPCHALNINQKYNEIVEKYPDSKMLAVDACLGDPESIEDVLFRDRPVCPGKGVGKDLLRVGDYSIVGIVDDSGKGDDFILRPSVRLSMVYDMAEIISNCIFEAYTRKFN